MEHIYLTGCLEEFNNQVDGELYFDNIYKIIYSTDASAYKEKPIGVLLPKNSNDIRKAVKFAQENSISIIPRAAGTSIAGQVVGNGLIVDCSKYMNSILEINQEEKWVRIQPGVVLDELNKKLAPYNLFFGPETSTSNRCMMGGMVGNNSCGTHSLVYGSTRDHTIELKVILSDGTDAVFKEISNEEYTERCKLESLEGEIYRSINLMLEKDDVRKKIKEEFPDKELRRRNTGYAIDILSEMQPFIESGILFNFCSLLCGSEGTLAFITEIKLNLVDVPPPNNGLLVVHHNTIEEALKANVLALRLKPVAVELIDKFLLDCTKNSHEHSKNRFFIHGDPGALLCVEFAENSMEEIERKKNELIKLFHRKGYGTHFPLLFGSDIKKVWALRKAGLGLLSNIPGDAKPQPVIEDTAVLPEKLPLYIDDFNKVLEDNSLDCVFYAHIGTGELHLRPIINLKEQEGVRLFRVIATEIARLVKKHKGSLSGEHGDGRLRGEFIPYMIGNENYELLKDIKRTWDPNNIFNSKKITDTPPMDTNLRFVPDKPTYEFDSVFDFSDTLGFVRMAEKCNGSADCRKSSIIGGVMCPSYQATLDEKTTTRARANMLREVLNSDENKNAFNNSDLFDVLDLCLSCKGCKTECPSGVDMAKLKAEFLYQYYKTNPIPLRTKIIANFSRLQSLAIPFASVYNFIIGNKFFSNQVKAIVGFSKKRSLPKVNRVTLNKWLAKNLQDLNDKLEIKKGELYFFIDEFTNFNEAHIGIKAIKLLNALGYYVNIIDGLESGRAKLSKGFLKKAKEIASINTERYSRVISESTPLVGIEPSAILTFKDEYIDLQAGESKIKTIEIAKFTFTIEEFLHKEFEKGNITAKSFTKDKCTILYHGHCQQKTLIGTTSANSVLVIPENYSVEEIKSGCCGMAGSFGYEKEHYDLSMKIGELILFPEVRKAKEEIVVAASGTSCRHHIKDGTGKIAYHPIEILYEALKKEYL